MKKKTTITTEKHEVWIIHPRSGPTHEQNPELPVAELPMTMPEVAEDSTSPLPTEQEGS
ncbi:MAG TPA: hypothetical protein VKB46_01820 [Pyrinomonadaceae bacterium]|nr:hypothetical protein [Pyrinomonadaceae bacterium]